MDRAYLSGAAGSAPTEPSDPSIGYPTAGNPSTGTTATKPGAYWYHMIMEELMAVIVAAGIAPASGVLNQLLQALRSAGVFVTQSVGDNSTKVATTAWVRVAMSNIATAAGFALVPGTNGYIKFPSWLGGFVVQWGAGTVTGPLVNVDAALPITFPNAGLVSFVSQVMEPVNVYFGCQIMNNSTIRFKQSGSAALAIRWIAFGY